LAAGLLLVASGCGNFQEAVRARAANEFSCPAETIKLVQIRPYRQPYAYSAYGCGKAEDYEGGCDVRGCLVEKRPSLAEQQARRRAWASEEGRSSSAPAPSRARAEGEMVSLTLHSDCPRTVRLFFGKTPKFGSGTESTIYSNSTENHSMREGDMVWIVDESGNGVTSLTASRGQTRVAITRSCSGFAPY